LLLGVSDDGSILGLEGDYQTLTKSNKDGFELHLSQLIGSALGAVFFASKVRVSFHIVNDLDVCKVEIMRAVKPVIIQTTDRNGQRVDKFYVRTGNSSRELTMQEMKDYCDERFS
jgi:hypothetical protein